MPNLRELLNRLRDRLRRDELSVELKEELRFHQTMLERDERTTGASGDEATWRARRQLGNATYHHEEARTMWSLGLIDDLMQDIRYALRVLRRNIGFTIAIVVTLALGIGANTAIFSVVEAVVLRPLPYAHPDRLVSIWRAPTGAPSERRPSSYPDLMDWRAQSTVFSGIAGYGVNRYELTGPEGVDQARTILGTADLYDVLQATPLLGRLPRRDEELQPVVTISYRLWKRRYNGDDKVLGKTVRLEGQPYTIIGVMGPGFHFPTPDIDAWAPFYGIATTPSPTGNNPWVASRSLHGYRVVARLAPGVTQTQAELAMNALQRRMAIANPDADGGFDIRLQSVRDDDVRDVQRALWTILGAAGLVLLLACANVAHLMLARISSRSREIAVRRALGAHRGRVVRQLLTESVLLAILGGAVGLAVAVVGTRVLVSLSPGDIPRLETVRLDSITLIFAVVASIATGLLFGIGPAMVGWGSGVQSTLREQGRGAAGGRQGGRVRSLLTSAEVAFALALLVGAGLMMRSFARLLSANLGVQPSGVIAFHVGLPSARYPGASAQVAGLDRVLDRLREVPGVTKAGASSSMPPSRIQQMDSYFIEGQPAAARGHEPIAIYITATPGFLDALGVPLIEGRGLTAADDSAPVAIVNRELVRRHFAKGGAVGQRINISGLVRTIVGVVGDATYEGPAMPVKPEVYVPFAQRADAGAWIAVRTSGNPAAFPTPIANALHAVDPEMNPRDLRPLDGMISDAVVRPRFQSWLLGTFGGLALLLAAVGIYGVIAYGVAQRTQEIGLRLALGAPAPTVVGLILRQGMRPVVVGLVAGVVLAWWLARLMAGLLYGIGPTDAPTFIAVIVVLGLVALIAAYIPARRAARVDPLKALSS